MPLYEYKCENCGHQFEVIQKFSDPLADKCPKCGGGPVRKLLSLYEQELQLEGARTPDRLPTSWGARTLALSRTAARTAA